MSTRLTAWSREERGRGSKSGSRFYSVLPTCPYLRALRRFRHDRSQAGTGASTGSAAIGQHVGKSAPQTCASHCPAVGPLSEKAQSRRSNSERGRAVYDERPSQQQVESCLRPQEKAGTDGSGPCAGAGGARGPAEGPLAVVSGSPPAWSSDGDDGDGWMAGLLLTRGEKRDTESDQLTHLHTTSFFSQPAPRQLTNRQTKRREERTSELMERPRTPPAPEH